ncbi:MAG TPA: hypothetical protein VG860_04020 [Terriglobia bacterium]|jgi:hypothetical protein|nr:hypothetical protein [Terriglobia bacterium]
MNSIRSFVATAVAVIGLAAVCWSQGMMRPPNIPGEFKPVVGSGAQYQLTDKKGAMHDWTWAVVGKGTADGQDAYWLEMRSTTPQGAMVMKELMVIQPGNVDIKRMIVQTAGRPPMEMPVGMMHMGMQHAQQQAASGSHGMGEVVGSESITVPAGTFDTQHYRSTDKGTTDVWASTKISPYGMVKMTSSDGTSMVLEKVLDHETSQITGEPQKMDFPMPGRPQ